MTAMNKVVSGEPLRVPADTWNAMIAATQYTEDLRGKKSAEKRRDHPPDGLYRVKNDTDEYMPRFSILGIDEPLFDPAVHLDAFKQEIIPRVIKPDADEHLCRFVVLWDPLQPGEVGRAWIDGLALVKVTDDSPDDAKYVKPLTDNTDEVEGTVEGPGFEIIWLQPQDDGSGTGTGTGTGGPRWAKIRMASCNASSLQPLPGECDCCPGCVCYPDDPDDIVDGCYLRNYRVVGNLPFSGSTTLSYVSSGLWESDDFDVVICGENRGSAHWELTVGTGCCDSELKLVGGGGGTGTGGGVPPIVYTNIRPFRAICATEFAFKEDCAIYADDFLKSVAHLWPTKVCVNPVGDTDSCAGGCPTTGVSLVCCPGITIPSVLNGNLSCTGGSNCTGFSGGFSLVHDPARLPAFGGCWFGTASVCGTTIDFQLACCTTSPGQTTPSWRLQYSSPNNDCSGGTIVSTGPICDGQPTSSETCDPLELKFFIGFSAFCPCSTGLPGGGVLTINV